MHEYLTVISEIEDFSYYTDVVVVRPATKVNLSDFDKMLKEFTKRRFLPILLPRSGVMDWPVWYPTDVFREIGGVIYYNGRSREFPSILHALEPYLKPETLDSVRDRSLWKSPYFSGGIFTYNENQKVFIYDREIMFGDDEADNRDTQTILDKLANSGWQLFPVSTAGIKIKDHPAEHQDLDFVTSSPFLGKDGQLHVICTESILNRLPSFLQTHVIPDKEVARGGCNISDHREGTLLVVPNRRDAPTTVKHIQEYFSGDWFEGPVGYLDGGGGLRCSISSFSL